MKLANFPVQIFEAQGPDGRIGRIHFNRPDKLNAFDHATCILVLRALDQWEDDFNLKGVIVTGEGPKAFCAGGDILQIYEHYDQPDALRFFRDSYRLILRLHAWKKN